MKKELLLILITLIIFSCASKKSIPQANTSEQEKTTKNFICPEDGICTIKILKNQSLSIKIDEFNHLYYQTKANIETSIIIFEYNRKALEGLQDGNYREEIIFEIDNSVSKLELQNEFLNGTKMIFGRHCYCKGQAGYFSVKKGSLTLVKNKEGINFNLEFTVTEVPQIVKHINYIVK
ncbi:hypothetical protein [Flavobacterium sp.]|uniref:hypothetical protein n=1 Tax=Flavobacterium sp. TaxID=239 RepID=UPI00374D64D0